MKKKSIVSFFFILVLVSCSNSKEYNVIIGQKITTSSEHPDYRASSFVDSNETNNIWNNGRLGQDWIQIDLNKSVNIDTIKFVMDALPPSTYFYDILIKGNDNVFKNVLSTNQFVQKEQTVIISDKIENVNSIKIVYKNDSSYIAIRDLKIIGY
jgi:hypothetical protein